ncbi:hypothetical protein [uncultured Litoreibacter sp.]|uniref:hypothetical protein n=1 Tax=uncultured Litoreibacter sp. TaxID=1392394 RepID=UPI00260C9857|nr:hypothetical protein [uncultured Litoreibacter sp.]
MDPDEITARAEPVGMVNAGEFACPTGKCARPIGVQFLYDDGFNTPIVDMPIELRDGAGAMLVAELPTTAPISVGARDAVTGTGALRTDLGVALYGEAPYNGAAQALTNPGRDIGATEQEAWELEKTLVAGLFDFEVKMTDKFAPFVLEWEREGFAGAGAEFVNGIGKGLSNWWNSEKEFWGSAWGFLKSSAAAMESYLRRNPDLSLGPIGISNFLSRKLLETWNNNEDEIFEALEKISACFKKLMAGDFDGFMTDLLKLSGLAALGGVIGEFGELIQQSIQDGIEWMNGLIEIVSYTPVLGLIANTMMKVVFMMTPNFWAKLFGEGTGFILPEVLIWAITSIIAALCTTTGVGAAASAGLLGTRAANLARKIRSAIKGSGAVRAVLAFMDDIAKIIEQIGPLGTKLRQAIRFAADDIMDARRRMYRPSSYYKRRLDELARTHPGAHGPQNHGWNVSMKALRERILLKKDPATNKIKNFAPPYSTKFNSAVDQVRAYDYLIENLDKYEEPLANARKTNNDYIVLKFDIVDLWEEKANVRFSGYKRVGSSKNPSGVDSVDFTDGTIATGFKVSHPDDPGQPLTLIYDSSYPKPKE